MSATVSASVSRSVTPSTSPAPSGAASFVLQASLYYPTAPARDPAAYTPAVLTVALTALKCDYATISGIKASEISFSSATPAVNAAAAPGLLAATATAAANASAADALDCYYLSLDMPPPADLLDAGSPPARRALQARGATVTAAAPLIMVALVFVLTPDAPVVGTVPLGTSVMPTVLAALTASSSNAALFTAVNSLWSAANGVSAWYSNATFFVSAAPTVYGDTPGAKVDTGLATSQQLGLALGLAIPLGIAAIVIAVIAAGGATCACCPCACACCRACRRRCARGELKPLDPEIALDRAANDLRMSRAAVRGEMMDGYADEAAANNMRDC